MDPDAFTSSAIALGHARGIGALDPRQRIVWLIAEAEAHCDKDGIESLVHRYGIDGLLEFAQAFHTVGAGEVAQALAQVPLRSGSLRQESLALANSLITARAGYSRASIRAAVAGGD